MKIRDVMTLQPLTVGPDASPETLRSLMAAGKVHHMPLVEDGQLVGMWLASEGGPVVLLGPGEYDERSPEADALDALDALVHGKEAVVVTEGEEPIGILTRTDALRLVQEGLDAEFAHRKSATPLVIRLVGPAGAGKTTLLLRTVAALRACQAGVIEANPQPVHRRLPSTVAGATVEYAPAAHWRKGLREAIQRLGSVDVVFVEDRDQPPRVGTGLGEDVQALVVPAADADQIDDASVRDAQAIVLTKPDAGRFDEGALRQRFAAQNPGAAVFLTGAGATDPGLAAWVRWTADRLRLHHT